MSKHLFKAHNVTFLRPTHPEIKLIQKLHGEASLHGTKLWDASFVLMDFLKIDGLDAQSKVLDIGCGWGPLTCFLQKEMDVRVISIDADAAVLPYLQLHAQYNDLKAHFWQAKISDLNVSDLSIADVIIGGDICFWDSLREDWKKLFKRAKKAGVRTLYLADPGRSPFNELVDWSADHFDIELWHHEIKRPVESEHYILQVNFDQT